MKLFLGIYPVSYNVDGNQKSGVEFFGKTAPFRGSSQWRRLLHRSKDRRIMALFFHHLLGQNKEIHLEAEVFQSFGTLNKLNGSYTKKKGANVMIRFFWWSDPASLDTKEPKAMFLFSQRDILMHWTKISLVAISKCGSKTPQTWDDIYHENLRVPLARCPNSQTLVVKMWSSIGSVYIDTKKLVQKKCLLLLIDKIQHLSIGIVDIVWVFIDVHSLSH